MDALDALIGKLPGLVPTGVAIVAVVIVIMTVRYVLNRRYAGLPGRGFRVQMIVLVLSFLGLLVVILSLPVSESAIGQLLSLLGILMSAAIALSATTFVGNIMAGLMLRAVKNFRPGDFIRVSDHFGRVSERGLFHIEIQTEDRDLTTLPNMYLVTNSVKVIRSSGTLVTAEVSLGYDVPRNKVEESLLQAAADTGLEEAFVHVVKLGDFAVTYRIAGLLGDVKSLISMRSRLKEMMLDRLHASGIEIVSPTFMNQRVLDKDRRFIAPPASPVPSIKVDQELPESLVFDKADEAETLEKLKERQEQLHEELTRLKADLSEASDDAERRSLKDKIDLTKERSEMLGRYILKRQEEDRK